MFFDDLLNEFIVEMVFVVARKAFRRRYLDNVKSVFRKFRNEETRRAFVRKSKLINRESEIQTIKDALQDDGSLRILYFHGPGGVGKTRLIE